MVKKKNLLTKRVNCCPFQVPIELSSKRLNCPFPMTCGLDAPSGCKGKLEPEMSPEGHWAESEKERQRKDVRCLLPDGFFFTSSQTRVGVWGSGVPGWI